MGRGAGQFPRQRRAGGFRHSRASAASLRDGTGGGGERAGVVDVAASRLGQGRVRAGGGKFGSV